MLKEVLIGAAGIGVGYFLAKRAMERRYIEMLDQEVRRTKEFFADAANYEGSQEGLDDPEFMEAAIRTADAMTEYTGGETKVNPSVLAQELETSAKSMDRPETDEELAEREKELKSVEALTNPAVRAKLLEGMANRVAYNKPGAPEVEEYPRGSQAAAVRAQDEETPPSDPNARAPYLITFAQFDLGLEELNHEPVSVSFFAGDGIVIDENENVITPERVEQIIGTDNLNKFGTLTEDPDMEPNVIYVRCERFGMDFEVTRSPGTHAVEVLDQTG